MTTDQTIEAEIQAKGLTAPRVTPADIEANIVSEHYFTADDGVTGVSFKNKSQEVFPSELACVTICTMILRNGHKIVGVNEGPVSPANFDPELGRKLARQKAIDQIWPLMGYELKCRLHAAQQPAPTVVLSSTVDEVKETLNNTPEGYSARFVATQNGRFTDVSVPANWPAAKQEGGAA